MMMTRTVTLQVRLPVGRTLALALVLLAIAFLLAEGLLRIPAITDRLATPSVGSQNATFESFIYQTDKTRARYGRIDCLFVGSSLVLVGIDTKAIEETFRAKTGEPIHCVKLALPGLAAPFVGDLSAFLIKVYHPRLLVYGGNVRDYRGYADVTQDPMVSEIVSTPWYRYYQGQFNLQGWLVDNSTAFRYYLTQRNWMKEPTRQPQVPGIDVRLPLQPEKEAALIREFARFEVNTPALRGIDKLASLNTNETQVVMAQIPMHPSFALYLKNGQADFDRAVAIVEHEATSHGLPYWRAENLPPLPDDLWWDRIHLKIKGGTIYSQWLAARMANAVQRGEIKDPTRPSEMEK